MINKDLTIITWLVTSLPSLYLIVAENASYSPVILNSILWTLICSTFGFVANLTWISKLLVSDGLKTLELPEIGPKYVEVKAVKSSAHSVKEMRAKKVFKADYNFTILVNLLVK